MKNYRKILIQFIIRLLFSVPLFIFGWYLIVSARGGWGAASQILFAMACFAAFAVIIAGPIAHLIAEPAGSMHYPDILPGPSEPDYSVPESLRERGLFEEAISEYEKMSNKYPDEIKPHIEMIDIAATNLKDDKRAEAVFLKGLSLLQDSEDRDVLKAMFEAVTVERQMHF